MKQNKQQCNFCKEDSTCLCYKCLNFYCDSCFKFAHNKEQFQSHKKDEIDNEIPIKLRCQEHNLCPMNLFCVDEKGII